MTNIVYNKNGIPFDIDAIATDVNGKLDTDMTNIGTLSASAISKLKEVLDGGSSSSSTGSPVNSVTIIDTYGDSTSYYIVFSNGYCIQGGFHDFLTSGASPVTITLLKTYANANYILIALNTCSYSGYAEGIMGGANTPFSYTNSQATTYSDNVTQSSFTLYDFVTAMNGGGTHVTSVTKNSTVWATSGFLAAGQY